jgi:hypothetical protein
MPARHFTALAEDMDCRVPLALWTMPLDKCGNPKNSFLPDESDDDNKE